jgi:hypothetical protein
LGCIIDHMMLRPSDVPAAYSAAACAMDERSGGDGSQLNIEVLWPSYEEQ